MIVAGKARTCRSHGRKISQQCREFAPRMRTKLAAHRQRLPHRGLETAQARAHSTTQACRTAGCLSSGPMAQCVVHALRSQKTYYLLQWVQNLGTPRNKTRACTAVCVCTNARCFIKQKPILGVLILLNFAKPACACAQRTGAAARELLRQDRPGGLMSPVLHTCGSASPFPTCPSSQ
jgi:hypothetical protein